MTKIPSILIFCWLFLSPAFGFTLLNTREANSTGFTEPDSLKKEISKNNVEISESYDFSKIALKEGLDVSGFNKIFSQSFVRWDKRTPLFVLRYDNYDNDGALAKYLDLQKESLGVALSLSYENWKFKIAGNVNVPEKGENFEALGTYLEWQSEKYSNFFKKVEIGLETDNRGKNLISGILISEPIKRISLFSGAASETIGKNSSSKSGFGFIGGDISQKYYLFLAGVQDFDSQKSAKIYGFSRNALFSETGLNPGIVLVYRDKPESDYFLGLITFGGKAMNKYVNQKIFEAFFSGAFSKTRIINNKNFDDIGVSPVYRTNDYGKIVLSLSWSEIDLGHNLFLKSNEEMIFYAFDNFQKIKSPYLSIGRFGETYLYYHQKMRDEYVQFFKTEIGWKMNTKNSLLNFAISNSFEAERFNWRGVKFFFSLKF